MFKVERAARRRILPLCCLCGNKSRFYCIRELPREQFVEELVDLYQRTNELHPFREGNGRTQRTFLTQLAGQAGYQLDFACVDKDELMIATIYAVQGVEEPLKKLFARIVQE